MKGSVTGNLRTAFGACLLFLILGAIASFVSIQSLLNSSKMVNHTHKVIKEVEAVLSTLKDAESGQRGFIITGDKNYLKPYQEAQEKVLKKIVQIQNLTSDNPAQQQSVRQLSKLTKLQLEEIQNLVAIKRQDKSGGVYLLDREKELMDEATILAKEMQLREYALLQIRTGNLNRFSTYSPILIVFVTILTVFISVFFYNKVKRDLEVRNALHRERELMQKKDEFISIASHELKTPLTSMKGYLQILELISTREGNLKYKNFISKAINQSEKLTHLVSDLLNVSKIQAGKLDYHFTTFPLSEIIEDVLAFATQTSPSHQIEIKGDINTNITADKTRIEQVIANFISNAIKYSPNSERIILEANQLKDDFLEVSVTDFGIGIPEEKTGQIFNRFYRVEDKALHASGLGIGLYIAYEIIKKHQGNITVRSQEGEGSTFTFTIPVRASNKQTA